MVNIWSSQYARRSIGLGLAPSFLNISILYADLDPLVYQTEDFPLDVWSIRILQRRLYLRP